MYTSAVVHITCGRPFIRSLTLARYICTCRCSPSVHRERRTRARKTNAPSLFNMEPIYGRRFFFFLIFLLRFAGFRVNPASSCTRVRMPIYISLNNELTSFFSLYSLCIKSSRVRVSDNMVYSIILGYRPIITYGHLLVNDFEF